jgi:hypothetical protein
VSLPDSPRAKPGILTWLAVAFLALFAVTDLAAHVTRYAYGETVSSLTWHLERLFPVLRVVVASVLVYLAGHLALGWPL